MKLLPENGGQFTSRFFLAVYQILSIEGVFNIAYHPKPMGKWKDSTFRWYHPSGITSPIINMTGISTLMPSLAATTVR